jgi:hypothetical protein
MKNLLATLLLLNLSPAAGAAPAALFSDTQIDSFAQKVKSSQKIPGRAVDILFDFYKHNRAATGGLKDTSCVDQKEFKIRNKDPKMTKDYLRSGIENETCLCVIDYTSAKTNERGHCIFLAPNRDPQIENFLVAHGRGSDEKDGVPTKFTNALTSTGTTLSGLFLTARDTYVFGGHAAGVGAYNSTGLSLYGVEKSNWTAANVGKATHGAPYVCDGKEKGHPKNVGRSLGCPAMTIEQSKKMIPRCTGKAAWLHYTTEIANKTDLAPQSCR